MYNLNNIKSLATAKKVSLKEIIAYCEISEGGFYKSIDNQSMNIKTVAKIAEFLKVSISELINDQSENTYKKNELKKNIVQSPGSFYESPKQEEKLYIEIAGLLKEKIEWMEKAHSLEIELERVKNANAPAKDALAG